MNLHVHPNYKDKIESLQKLITNFENTGEMLSDGTRNTIKIFDFEGEQFTIKSFKKPHVVNQIAYRYFRKSKARRSFEYAELLIEKQIGTAFPVAYVENQSVIGLLDSYYISRKIDYDLTYRELIHQPDYPDRLEILKQFTTFTWHMHEQGVYFKDHSPGNTLIVKDGDAYTFYLVDLNRMSFYDLNFDDRMKNFSRLTPQKGMVELMSKTYAELINKPFDTVFNKMWFYTEEFQNKFQRKQDFKNKYLKRKRD